MTAVLPEFSVVIPLYNSEPRYLSLQLQAVAEQSYPLWECILVDDGSPDRRAAQIAARWVAGDSHRRLIRQPVNGGIAAATNAGLDQATGDFVVFCDHDDVIHRDALGRVRDAIAADPDIDLLYTDEELIDSDGRFLADYPKPDFDPVRVLSHNYFNHITVMRRTVLGELRLRRECEPSQDFDLVLRMLLRCRAVAHLPIPLYSWRAAPGSVALSIDEKPHVRRSVTRGAQQALLDRGIDAEIEPVEGDPGAVRIRRLGEPQGTVAAVTVAYDITAAMLTKQLLACEADVAVILPHGAVIDSAGIKVLALLAEDEGVAAVGPMVATVDGYIVSAGRAHSPVVRDLGSTCMLDNGGPGGAFNVTRQVSSVSPWGCAIRLDRWRSSGGFRTDASLDAAIAVWCTQQGQGGYSVLWTPLAHLVVAPGWPLLYDSPDFDDEIDRLAAEVPALRREVRTPLLRPLDHEPESHGNAGVPSQPVRVVGSD